MIKKLFDLRKTRSFGEAIVFFLICGLLVFLVSNIIATILHLITWSDKPYLYSLTLGYRIGIGLILNIVTAPILSFLILKKKNLLNKPLYVFLSVLSPILAWALLGVGGLLVPAFLTTKKN